MQKDLILHDLGSPQTISNVFHGRQQPNNKFLFGFLKMFPDLDARWLITGEGDMLIGDGKSQANVANKSTVGSMNIGSSVSSTTADNNIVVENSYLKKEIKLKDQIIKDKEEQISLLKELIKK
ncbi:MAG: hypothetical protein N4A72_00745 [Bacteroidales bacterium]|nr:hypothetical protein [Bacteroidales bacterium]